MSTLTPILIRPRISSSVMVIFIMPNQMVLSPTVSKGSQCSAPLLLVLAFFTARNLAKFRDFVPGGDGLWRRRPNSGRFELELDGVRLCEQLCRLCRLRLCRHGQNQQLTEQKLTEEKLNGPATSNGHEYNNKLGEPSGLFWGKLWPDLACIFLVFQRFMSNKSLIIQNNTILVMFWCHLLTVFEEKSRKGGIIVEIDLVFGPDFRVGRPNLKANVSTDNLT